MTPRGVRNHNPGNIEKGAAWIGLAEDQSSDPRFAVFKAPEYGIRAMVRVLRTYQLKYNLRSIEGMISRWAPPGGGDNNHTDAYIAAVSKEMGIPPDQPFNVMYAQYARPMVKAMIRVENGVQPYPDEVIDKALELANVKET